MYELGLDMYFLMTNDVEEHSIALNRLDDATAWRVYREGLPKLLELYSKYDVLSLEEQISELEKAKNAIEPIAGKFAKKIVECKLIGRNFDEKRMARVVCME